MVLDSWDVNVQNPSYFQGPLLIGNKENYYKNRDENITIYLGEIFLVIMMCIVLYWGKSIKCY